MYKIKWDLERFISAACPNLHDLDKFGRPNEKLCIVGNATLESEQFEAFFDNEKDFDSFLNSLTLESNKKSLDRICNIEIIITETL